MVCAVDGAFGGKKTEKGKVTDVLGLSSTTAPSQNFCKLSKKQPDKNKIAGLEIAGITK